MMARWQESDFAVVADQAGRITYEKTAGNPAPFDVEVQAFTLRTVTGCSGRTHKITLSLDGQRLLDAVDYRDREDRQYDKDYKIKPGDHSACVEVTGYSPNQAVQAKIGVLIRVGMLNV
jgi:hypothetical protein